MFAAVVRKQTPTAAGEVCLQYALHAHVLSISVKRNGIELIAATTDQLAARVRCHAYSWPADARL